MSWLVSLKPLRGWVFHLDLSPDLLNSDTHSLNQHIGYPVQGPGVRRELGLLLDANPFISQMRRWRPEEAEWRCWGHREVHLAVCIAVLYAPKLFPKTPPMALGLCWWLRPTLVPLAVNCVLQLLLPVTVQVLTLMADLGPLRFHWVWILVTSPSLPGLPMDLFQARERLRVAADPLQELAESHYPNVPPL